VEVDKTVELEVRFFLVLVGVSNRIQVRQSGTDKQSP